MLKKLLPILVLGFSFISSAQDCPTLLNPQDGDVGVPVDTQITWSNVENIQSFLITIGTTPNGGEIINNRGVGNVTTFTPEFGLPENTVIYVTITIFFFNQPNIVCTTESFTTEDVTTAPNCTSFRNIADGDTDISIFTNISWNYSSTSTGYRITLGTASGIGDLLNNFDVGNILTFNPDFDLPPETLIYVQIVPYNENGEATNCQEISFTTGELTPLPDCTSLISPRNNDVNVSLSPRLEWQEVSNADGYRITIGTSPNSADILDNGIFSSSSAVVINFEPNTTFFIRIVPFNSSGDAIGCQQEVFSTVLGCGPYLDPNTNQFIDLRPDFDFPSVFSFCENEGPLVVTAPIIADGYRWFSIDQFGDTSLFSEERSITVTETGQFQLEVYDLVTQPGDIIECATLVDFDVVSSEAATINNLRFEDEGSSDFRVVVEATGIGDYEYAIDNIDGPYQDSNVFNNVSPGSHVFYVRDKNGCGIVEETFEQDLTVEGFPKFFTPNGDGINDFWQFIQPIESEPIVLQSIHIFDRFGNLLKQIDQSSQGWDGNLNGRALPASDYWFLAIDDENRQFRGHFALKR